MTVPGASVRKGNFTLMDRIDISEMALKTSFLTADLDAGIDIDSFLERFSALVPEGLTVVSAGDNPICRYVVGRIAANFDGTEAIWHPVPWITPEEVDDRVLAFGSEFRKEYGNGFTEAYLRLAECLARMEDTSDTFVRYVREKLTDTRMRDAVDRTLKTSCHPAGKINGRNVILVRDETDKDGDMEIGYSYVPLSLTVLTLVSEVF